VTKAARKSTVAPKACFACRFFHLPEERNGIGLCSRYPESVFKKPQDSCGEFKQVK
jgi:hypothetical protein